MPFLSSNNICRHRLHEWSFISYLRKKLSSDIGYKGIGKKIMIFLIVGLGNILDQYIIGSGSSLRTIRTMLIMFYLTNEGISIIENAGKMGIPLPEKLKNVLSQLQNQNK